MSARSAPALSTGAGCHGVHTVSAMSAAFVARSCRAFDVSTGRAPVLESDR